MGGEGPYVRFDPAYRSASWASHTGLTPLNDEELEAAYSRAKDFLMDKKRELVNVHGWSVQPEEEEEEEEEDTLFVVTGQCGDWKKDVRLSLPLRFASFLGEAKGTWQNMFEHYWLFTAKRHHKSNDTLFIDSPGPVADIFYLLQILAPGMLLIVRVDDYDRGEEETTRALPSEEWLKRHQSALRDVLGSSQRFEQLSNAAADFGKSFRGQMISDYREYESDNDNGYYTNAWGFREVKDFTACDSECGYCGTCDY